jgi:hypothetical protein
MATARRSADRSSPRKFLEGVGGKKSNFLSRRFNPANFSPVKHTYLSLDRPRDPSVKIDDPDLRFTCHIRHTPKGGVT